MPKSSAFYTTSFYGQEELWKRKRFCLGPRKRQRFCLELWKRQRIWLGFRRRGQGRDDSQSSKIGRRAQRHWLRAARYYRINNFAVGGYAAPRSAVRRFIVRQLSRAWLERSAPNTPDQRNGHSPIAIPPPPSEAMAESPGLNTSGSTGAVTPSVDCVAGQEPNPFGYEGPQVASEAEATQAPHRDISGEVQKED